MARVVVLGSGIAGHTAAIFLKKWLGKVHEVVVISPNSKWNWIPSNIWVGVGDMTKEDVTFELAPVYEKVGILYYQARAISIHPEGSKSNAKPFVTIEFTGQNKIGHKEEITYDYLINATGPKLNFGATPGLVTDSQIGSYTVSVCTADHAEHAAKEFNKLVEKMRKGQSQKILIGMGHGTCTCQGAAFEYVFNVDFVLRKLGVRDRADITFITNEAYLGDFGVGGMHVKERGFIVSSRIFAESLFAERGIDYITGAHVNLVEAGKVTYELLDGSTNEINFDFAMLIPPFSGAGLKSYNRSGEDITDKLFAQNGFMKVDADYTLKPYEEWKAIDWPRTYQNPIYKNIFAAGIAFAPPHIISKPRKSPNGTVINPTPPRTGMPSAIIGKTVAKNISDMILKEIEEPLHTASMAEMGAACVASAGKSFLKGLAASMTMYPIVPDYEKYPETGRDLNYTFGEIGLAGHWIKHFLHHMFLYKAKLKPFWWMIPE